MKRQLSPALCGGLFSVPVSLRIDAVEWKSGLTPFHGSLQGLKATYGLVRQGGTTPIPSFHFSLAGGARAPGYVSSTTLRLSRWPI